MKAFKLLLLTLFAALGLAAQAQTIEVYKDGQVIDTFSATQVDSVVYKQVAAIPKYYYYVGTVKPTADSDIEANGKLTSDNNSNVIITDGKVSEIIALPETDQYIYFVYPKEWGIATILDKDGDNVGLANKTSLSSFAGINNYYIYRATASSGSMRCYITYTPQ